MLATTTPRLRVDDASCDFACYGCTDPVPATTTATRRWRTLLRLRVLRLHGPRCLQLRRHGDGGRRFLRLHVLRLHGVIDDSACNYDATATVDDGVLYEFACYGCDGSRCLQLRRHGRSRMTSDASCDFTCYGCTVSVGQRTTTATVDDASCDFACYGFHGLLEACNDDDRDGMDSTSCDFACYGCTDPLACNYDATATVDDASCDILPSTAVEEPLFSCDPIEWTTVPATSQRSGTYTDVTCNYDPQRRWRTTLLRLHVLRLHGTAWNTGRHGTSGRRFLRHGYGWTDHFAIRSRGELRPCSDVGGQRLTLQHHVLRLQRIWLRRGGDGGVYVAG